MRNGLRLYAHRETSELGMLPVYSHVFSLHIPQSW
jgi:hypothetical protein